MKGARAKGVSEMYGSKDASKDARARGDLVRISRRISFYSRDRLVVW